MTDEEKKVIQTYEKFLDGISKNGGCTIDIDFQHKKEYEAMWKVLDLIERQQKEKELHIKLEQQYKKEYLDAKEEIEKKDKYIYKLENKLMYALSPTTHELALTTQEQFKTIIRDNLEKDTYTIKRALKEYWEDK